MITDKSGCCRAINFEIFDRFVGFHFKSLHILSRFFIFHLQVWDKILVENWVLQGLLFCCPEVSDISCFQIWGFIIYRKLIFMCSHQIPTLPVHYQCFTSSPNMFFDFSVVFSFHRCPPINLVSATQLHQTPSALHRSTYNSSKRCIAAIITAFSFIKNSTHPCGSLTAVQKLHLHQSILHNVSLTHCNHTHTHPPSKHDAFT